MAKAQIHDKPQDTPSQAIIKSANEVVFVTDANGREIGIKRLNALERYEMLELIGGTNDHAMGYAALAFHVVSINGEDTRKPKTREQLKAAIQRLGDEGLDAVASGIAQNFDPNKVIGTDDVKN